MYPCVSGLDSTLCSAPCMTVGSSSRVSSTRVGAAAALPKEASAKLLSNGVPAPRDTPEEVAGGPESF